MVERFLNYFEPVEYMLNLDIKKKDRCIDGMAFVSGIAKTKKIKFHAVNLEIESVIVAGERDNFKYDGKVLEIFNVPTDDETQIVICYKARINENMQGAYLSTYEYKGRIEEIVATQFESHYAREAFPCIDEPAAKAIFNLCITVPGRDDMVVSNMPAIDYHFDEDEDGEEVVVTRFLPTPPMSTYLLAWVVGRFNRVTGHANSGLMVSTYVPLNHDKMSARFANRAAIRAINFYEKEFGTDYVLPKMSQVALPDFEAGAMENWGLVTYRESMLLVDKGASLSTKKTVALTVAHELAHQWFGNLVTMKWWDDLWLNESFATVLEYFAVDAIYPQYRIWENFFTGECIAALRRDCISGVQSVHQDVSDPEEIATLFDGAIVYAKGARLILMVIRLMGWETFCKALADYFDKYAYENTVGDDFWKVLNKHADFDVKKMMHAFIDEPGYPVVTGKTQKRFLVDGKMPEANWPLPEIKEDMSGHYILNLNDKEFKERLSRFDELSLEEKLRLLIDRDLVSKTDLAPSASLIPLISKFKNEDSAAVWSMVSMIVSGLRIFFEFGSSEEAKYKKFVSELVGPELDRIGLKTKKDDDENILRQRTILLALDFYAGTEENLKKLASFYNNNYDKMDPEIRADILDAKICLEPKYVDEYIEKYKKETDPEIKDDILTALTLMKDKDGLLKVMELLEQIDVVKPQDQIYLFVYLYRNPLVRAEVFEWLTTHWDFVKKLSGDKSLDTYPRCIAGMIKNQADFDKYLKFFEPLSGDPVLKRAVTMGKNEISARLKLIKKDKAGVIKNL